MTGSCCSYQIGAQSIINQDRALLVIGFTSVNWTRNWLSYITLYIYIMCVCMCVCPVQIGTASASKKGAYHGLSPLKSIDFLGFMGINGGYQLGYQLINPGFIAKSPVYLFIMLLRMLPGSN